MTYVNDPIGDLLTRIRNAQRVRHSECRVSWSRLKEHLCEILRDNGWIANVTVIGEDPKKYMVISFNPDKMNLEIKRISKPGRRVYQGVSDMKPILSGYGMAVLTTSRGLMTDKDAKKNNVGGEILCTIA